MKMLMTLPTNDKNLNSEIETTVAACPSADGGRLPMIRISILKLKQLLNRRCTKGLRIQLSYWSIKVCSVGRTISLTGR